MLQAPVSPLLRPRATNPLMVPAFLRRRPEFVLTPLVALVFVVTWEIAVRTALVSSFVLPAPSAIFGALLTGFGNRTFLQHALVTMGEAAAGFAIAVPLGIAVGAMISEFRILERAVYPSLVALQTMPKIALAPLLVVWFGFGPSSKIAVAALISFFPVLVTTLAGLRGCDRGRLDVLRALGAGRWRCFCMVRLPSALPQIFSGLSIAVVFAMTGTIVAEFLGASAGLGYLIIQANVRMDIPQVFAVLLVLGALGVCAYAIVQLIRRHLLFWAP